MADSNDRKPDLSTQRALEFEVDVSGTPEQVWEAIATGPGISSWYVPHTFDGHAGAAAVASFGDAPELQVPGRVAAWEPPHRIVFDGGEDAGGLVFEWLVEARDNRTCIVRLVNTGFGTGEEWDAQYDGLAQGWPLFLRNLQLHLAHFPGQRAVSMLPMAVWSGTPEQAMAKLLTDLGIVGQPEVGGVLRTGAESPLLRGTVTDVAPGRVALLLDAPAPGTAFLAAEAMGGQPTEQCGVSVWSYLYGAEATTIVELDKPRWETWLGARA
jgi:uncharacterized protein YndB with AHSA1/START domain